MNRFEKLIIFMGILMLNIFTGKYTQTLLETQAKTALYLESQIALYLMILMGSAMVSLMIFGVYKDRV